LAYRVRKGGFPVSGLGELDVEDFACRKGCTGDKAHPKEEVGLESPERVGRWFGMCKNGDRDVMSASRSSHLVALNIRDNLFPITGPKALATNIRSV